LEADKKDKTITGKDGDIMKPLLVEQVLDQGGSEQAAFIHI